MKNRSIFKRSVVTVLASILLAAPLIACNAPSDPMGATNAENTHSDPASDTETKPDAETESQTEVDGPLSRHGAEL